jgi:hypothetical protein
MRVIYTHYMSPRQSRVYVLSHPNVFIDIPSLRDFANAIVSNTTHECGRNIYKRPTIKLFKTPEMGYISN